MVFRDRNDFWGEAFTLDGSIRLHVISYVFVFGLIASLTCGLVELIEWFCRVRVVLEVAPYEIAGAALGLLLVLRTNAGYDRWWEGRKLWGGIVNQSRNAAVSATVYGPDDAEWQEKMNRLLAAFPYVSLCCLRAKPPSEVVARLVGAGEADQIAKANHMPSYVSARIADLLREARDRFGMDGFGFMQIDRERVLLIDHVGACERILKTPLPKVYGIEIRRFIALFLLMLPLVLLHRLDGVWMVPFITMIVAYPLLAIDQIGIELQNPFSTENLGHLPLDELCSAIEGNVSGILKAKRTVEP